MNVFYISVNEGIIPVKGILNYSSLIKGCVQSKLNYSK